MTRFFEARFDGQCTARCGAPIEKGDLVRYWEDEIYHHECAPDPRPESPPEPAAICPQCWTKRAVNGACGCIA